METIIVALRFPELPAHSSGQHDDREHYHLHGRLPAEAAGVSDGLLLELLGSGQH